MAVSASAADLRSASNCALLAGEVALGAALGVGGELHFEGFAALGEGALEVVGVAVDGLARDAVGQRELLPAVWAEDGFSAADDDFVL